MSNDIASRIYKAGTAWRREHGFEHEAKYVALSQAQYDELWQYTVDCIDIISIVCGRQSPSEARPPFEKLIAGLIPVVTQGTAKDTPYAYGSKDDD